MKKYIFFVLYLVSYILCLNSNAQISYGGKPYSFYKSNISDNIPLIVMPEVNIAKLMTEDAIEEKNNYKTWRFGKDINVSINTANSGKWETMSNGDRLWRVGIKSSSAFSLNFIFNKFRLPAGSKFFIYNNNRTQLLGAFTEKNNRDDGYFSTTLIKGEAAIFEYYEPADAKEEGIISLYKVIHGYKDFYAKAKGFGNSGPCNVNVNCPAGISWYNEKRAVAMILRSFNTRICTGTLVNNTREDGTPYFLTAQHCVEGDSVKTWVFMFNYESPDCTNKDGQTNQTVNGASLKASDLPSDFALLELSTPPPGDYNVYFAGWSAEDNPSDSCVTIHHPNGDIKKVSLDKDVVISSNWDTGVEGSHWTIYNWDIGTTERGSSGAPLFNKHHKLIGQLHGGFASCQSQADSDTTNDDDNFGKFAYSWDRGISVHFRLKEWLDPQNTGVLTLNGKNSASPLYNYDASLSNIIEPTKDTSCATSTTPRIVIKNNGSIELTSVNIFYKMDNNALNKYEWNGKLKYMQTAEITMSDISISTGAHKFTAWISKPNNTDDENTDNDTLTVNFSTIPGNNVTITIRTDKYPLETSWEIKDSLDKIVNTNPVLSENSFMKTDICLADGCYHFRIFDSYHDGFCINDINNDSTFVMLSYNKKLLGYISGCSFDSIAGFKFCVEYPDNITSIGSNNPEIRIYPNPSQGFIFIDRADHPSSASCAVYTIYGNKVCDVKINNRTQNKIDIRFLDNGIYFVVLNDNYSKVVRKIVLTK